jgi:peptidyl-prolyl cis-trans isomerase B (cyclophilin B)
MKKLNLRKPLVVMLLLALALNCKEKKASSAASAGSPYLVKNNEGKTMEKTAIITTKFGNIVLRFFPDIAPKHVDSFIKLAEQGFYNGTTFHRVIPGFMIQGGDPNSKDASNRAMHGTGGPGYNVPAEFSNKPHQRGILSMARSANPDSAGSQFFICVADASFLDGQYTVFGEVIEGLDVVDQIVNVKRDGKDNPIEQVQMEVQVQQIESH